MCEPPGPALRTPALRKQPATWAGGHDPTKLILLNGTDYRVSSVRSQMRGARLRDGACLGLQFEVLEYVTST